MAACVEVRVIEESAVSNAGVQKQASQVRARTCVRTCVGVSE